MGGDPGTLVRLDLYAGQGTAEQAIESYTDASAGSITIQPSCANGACGFGLQPSSTAGITLTVEPNPDQLPTVTAPGITGPVQLFWSYSYNFTGLSLGD